MSFHDISPLLNPPTGLLLLATHSPPKFSSSFTDSCSIRILRVLSPLDIHNSGALRLVSLFERAQLVAQCWRESAQQISIAQLAESEPGSEFNVLESFGSNPGLSNSPPAQTPVLERSVSSFISNLSSLRRKRPTRLSKSPSHRAFDAVVNFIPSSLPEKLMLKAAILVTTLSHQFLATPITKHPTLPPNRRHSLMFKSTRPLPRVRRWSVWSRSLKISVLDTAVQSAQVSPTLHGFASESGKAHLIHVLPDIYSTPISVRRDKTPLKPRLVQKIEQFLLNFSYQLSHTLRLPEPPPLSRPGSFASISSYSSLSSQSSTYSSLRLSLASSVDGDEMERPVPYLLSTKILAHVLKVQDLSSEGHININIAGLILYGALDPEFHNTKTSTSEDGISRYSTLLDGLMVDVDTPRAWIGSIGDVRISAGTRATSSDGLDDSDGYFADVSLDTMQPAGSSVPMLVVTPSDQVGTSRNVSATPVATGLPTPSESSKHNGSSSLSRDADEDCTYRRKRASSAATVPRIASKFTVPAPPLPTGPSRTLIDRKTLLARLKFWKTAS